MLAAVGGAILIGLVSTLGDFIWAMWIPRHRPVYGLAHGALLCLCIGAYLGALVKRPLLGAAAGTLIGLTAAGGYYVLARLLGYAAMFVLWMALWLLVGVLNGPMLRPGSRLGEALARGVAAAVLSGLGFYAISGIWLKPRPGGPDYAYNWLCWTIALLPGFMALLAFRRDSRTLP